LPLTAGQIPTSRRASVDFPDAEGADDGQDASGGNGEGNPAQDRDLAAGSRGNQGLYREIALRWRQGHAFLTFGQSLQEPVEPVVGVARTDDVLPQRHHLDQRRQHARPQHPGDDHHATAAGQFSLQRQPGAGAEESCREGRLQHLGEGRIAARMIGGLCLQAQEVVLLLHPAPMDAAQHPHGLDHLRIAQSAIGVVLGGDGLSLRGDQRRLGVLFGEVGEKDLKHGGDHRNPAEQRINQKDQNEKQQRNRRIHQRHERRRRQEIPDGAQVVESLAGAAGNTAQVGLEDRVENPLAKLPVESLAGLMHDPGARPLQQLHDDIEPQDQEGQHEQGVHTAAVDHPVIHLEHVAGWCQDQQGAKDAEQGGLHEEGFEFADGFTEFRAGFSRFHHDSRAMP
jgi:hypothetical protein